MTTLTETFKFKRGLEIKNRIVMAPMTTKMSFFDGVITRDELNYYGLRTGEVGAIITAAANVQANGKGWEGELGVYDDKFIHGLSKLAATIKQNDTKAILQIFHGGRMTDSKVLRGEQVVSASAIAAEREGAEVPRELTEIEILEIIESFKNATKRAIQAGFDGVEIHGANTYLIQQFFSPHSNRREDKWGGTLEKRFNFINELVNGVTDIVDQSGIQGFIVGYRFSPEEYEVPGISFSDTLYLVDKLSEKPLDYLHISLNQYDRISLNHSFVEKTILAHVHEKINNRVPLIGVGNIQTLADVNETLLYSEFVAVGRALLIDPHWTNKIINGQEHLIRRTLSHYDQEELIIGNGVWGFLEQMMPERLIK